MTSPTSNKFHARHAFVGFAVIYGALLAYGIVGVASSERAPTTPGVQGTTPPPGNNAADFRRGARARVSSHHATGMHHPMYLIDGKHTVTLLEKWVSNPDDRAPWLEIILPKPNDITRVDIAHAGIREPDAMTMDRYTITCFDDLREVAKLPITGNTLDTARHAVDCAQTTRVRIDFEVGPLSSPRGVARIYEVRLEASGTRP